MCQLLDKSPEYLRKAFFSLQSFKDVADLLEVSESQLKYYLYVVTPDHNYSVFSIPKKGGGKREITAPSSSIKCIQKKLAQVLDAVYQPKGSAHGFIRGKSIVTNALRHVQQKHVLNIDLKDFFPSIKFMRVRSKLMVFPYELNATVATIISQICCYKGSLPQGAPTSPVVSNFVCAKMDSQLRKFAVEHRCRYTRYADDITISTGLKEFPVEIAFLEPTADGIN